MSPNAVVRICENNRRESGTEELKQTLNAVAVAAEIIDDLCYTFLTLNEASFDFEELYPSDIASTPIHFRCSQD